jgi:hypothetical protein
VPNVHFQRVGLAAVSPPPRNPSTVGTQSLQITCSSVFSLAPLTTGDKFCTSSNLSPYCGSRLRPRVQAMAISRKASAAASTSTGTAQDKKK